LERTWCVMDPGAGTATRNGCCNIYWLGLGNNLHNSISSY